jgi:hypothetical protein
MKNMKKLIMNSKKTFFFLLFSIFVIHAQTDIVSQIGTWKQSIKTILDAAVAVFAIAGGFIVFLQYMQGSEQAQRNFIR